MVNVRGVVSPGPGSEPLRVLLRGEDSAGAIGVVEMELASGSSGPPLHVHPTHGEGFYVLAGELNFAIGDEVVIGGPGTWVFAPQGTPHTFANFGSEHGRLLCVFAPSGFEHRFVRALAGRTRKPAPDELSEAERETRTVGPPLTIDRRRDIAARPAPAAPPSRPRPAD